MVQLAARRLTWGALALASLCCLSVPANAGFIRTTMDLRSTRPLEGTSLSFTEVGLTVDGVTFDATVSVTGSAKVRSNNNGLGVEGGTPTLIGAGEWLKLTMNITNVTGGAVLFDGFAGVGLENFENNDRGFVSSNLSGSPVLAALVPRADTFGLSSLSTTIFVVGHHPVSTGTSSFRLKTVSAQFSSVAAVPEPATGTLFLSGLVFAAGYRNRRRQN